jgi:hypothetical protein
VARRFDRQQADAFTTALKAALSDHDAAAYAGVDLATVRSWRRRRQFDADVTKAKAEIALLHAGRVHQAARTDWRASLLLSQIMAADRELARLRELTTDARP